MIETSPFIFYTLPKSRTSQQLIGGRKIEKAWNNICHFLTNVTTVSPDKPTNVSLTAYTAFPHESNPEIAEKIVEQTKAVFGNGITEPIAYSYPGGIPDKQTKTRWDIAVTDLQSAIDYLIAGQPWPRFFIGPVELVVSFNFKLVDPATNMEIPYQQHRSSILIWLSRNSSCSPGIYFPFGQADDSFRNMLEKLMPFFPFKLEEKYLRQGRPNKNKTKYVYTKLKSL